MFWAFAAGGGRHGRSKKPSQSLVDFLFGNALAFGAAFSIEFVALFTLALPFGGALPIEIAALFGDVCTAAGSSAWPNSQLGPEHVVLSFRMPMAM